VILGSCGKITKEGGRVMVVYSQKDAFRIAYRDQHVVSDKMQGFGTAIQNVGSGEGKRLSKKRKRRGERYFECPSQE